MEVLADAVEGEAAQAQEVTLQLLPVLDAGDGGEGQLTQLRVLHEHRPLKVWAGQQRTKSMV